MIPPVSAVRLICCVTTLLVAVGTGPAVAAAGLSDVTGDRADAAAEDVADEDEVDGRSTEATVRLVVGSLIAVAGGTALMMLMFIWHTSPRRRFRVATRRAERRRSAAASVDGEVDEVGHHHDAADDAAAAPADDAPADAADPAADAEDHDADESEDSGVGGSRE